MKRLLLTAALVALFAVPAHAGFDEGKAAYDKKDWVTAIKELRPLAEAGDDRAMIVLGNMYYGGWGVGRDRKEAVRLYKMAAIRKNNPQAMALVGGMYTQGAGVEKNLNTALQWYERAARRDGQEGALFAGLILARGNKDSFDSVKPDMKAAYIWLRRAEAGPDAKISKPASELATGVAKRLKPGQRAEADKILAAWKPAELKDLGPPPAEPVPRALLEKEKAEKRKQRIEKSKGKTLGDMLGLPHEKTPPRYTTPPKKEATTPDAPPESQATPVLPSDPSAK